MNDKLKPCPFCGNDNAVDKEMYDQLEREKKTVETIVDYLFELKRTFIIHDWNEFVEEHSGYAKPPEVEE